MSKNICWEKTYVLSQLLEEARCSLLPQLKTPWPHIVLEGRGSGEQLCSLFHRHISETDGKVRWWHLTNRTFVTGMMYSKVNMKEAKNVTWLIHLWMIDGTCLECPAGDVYTTRYLSGASSGGVQVARKDLCVTSDVTKLVGASGGPPVWCIKTL